MVCTEEVWEAWEATSSRSSSTRTAESATDRGRSRERGRLCLAAVATKSRAFVQNVTEEEWTNATANLASAKRANTVARRTRSAETRVVVQVIITVVGETMEVKGSMAVRVVKVTADKVAMEEAKASEEDKEDMVEGKDKEGMVEGKGLEDKAREGRASGVKATSTKEVTVASREGISKVLLATTRVRVSRKDGDDIKPYFEALQKCQHRF